jgi:drug/metabolite transporter (DMT)-like permease
MWLGVLVAVGGAVLLVLAAGLLRRRGWARWGVVVGFSLAGVAALAALLAALAARGVGVAGKRWMHQPPPELVPPAVFLVISVAVVVLLLLPSTASDFSASGQTPRRDEGPRQEGSAP